MANSVAVQTILDGDRNVVMKLTGVLDTSDEARTIKVNVAILDPIPTQLAIVKISYAISDQLEVLLDWDATTPVAIVPLAGRGEMNFEKFMGLINNAGAGKTGNIYLTTSGYASGKQVYSIVLEMIKQGV